MLFCIGCPAALAENVTMYSLTGYNFDDEAKTYYSGLGINLADSPVNTSVNGGDSPLATLTVTDTSSLYTNDNPVLFGGALGGSESGYKDGTWGSYMPDRVSIVDLKAVRAIDRIDIFADQYSKWQGGHIKTIKIEAGSTADADSSDWTQIAYTDEEKDKDNDKVLEDDNTQHNVYHYAMPLSKTVNARYLKMTISAAYCFELTHMSILGKTMPSKVDNTKKTLKVLSDNTPLTTGWYVDNDYKLTYMNTGADYMWNTSYMDATGTTGISDEQSVFDTTIVDGNTGRPDMQDGGIEYGGNYSCNTTGNWGSANKVSIIWDFKALKILDRLDIIHSKGNYNLTKIAIYGRQTENDDWTEISSYESPTTNTWGTSHNIDIYNLGGGIYRYLRADMTSKYQVNLAEMYIFGDGVPEVNTLMFTQDRTAEMTDAIVPGESVTAWMRTKYNAADMTLQHIAADGETVIKTWKKSGSETTITLDPSYTSTMKQSETLKLVSSVTANGSVTELGNTVLAVGSGSVSNSAVYNGTASADAYYRDDFDEGKISAESITGGSDISFSNTDGYGKSLSIPYNANGDVLKVWEGFDAPVKDSKSVYSIRVKPSSNVSLSLKVKDAQGGTEDKDGLHLLDIDADGNAYMFGQWEYGASADGFTKGNWNQIDAVINQKTKKGEVYINGKLVVQNEMPEECSAYTSIDAVGMIFYSAAEGGNNCYDNVAFYKTEENGFAADNTYAEGKKLYIDFTSALNLHSFKPTEIKVYEVGGQQLSVTCTTDGSRLVIESESLKDGAEYKVVLPYYMHDVAARKIADGEVLINAENSTGKTAVSKLRLIDLNGNEILPEGKTTFNGVKLYFDTSAEDVCVNFAENDYTAVKEDSDGKVYGVTFDSAAEGGKTYTIKASWNGGERSFSIAVPEDYEISEVHSYNNYLTDKVTVNAVLKNNSVKNGLEYTAFAAIYDGEKLVSVDGAKTSKLALGGKETVSVEVARPDDYDKNYELKLFLWDNVEHIKALCVPKSMQGAEEVVPVYEETELARLKTKYDAKGISDGFNIGLITDVQSPSLTGYRAWSHHYGSLVKASEIIELDCLADLGDMTDGGFVNREGIFTLMREQSDIMAEAKLPTFRIRGNHDNNRAAVYYNGNNMEYNVTPEEWLEACDLDWGNVMQGSTAGKNGYYYKDFADYKIRVIALDTVDVPYTGGGTYEYGVSHEQLKWLAEEALDFSGKTDKKEWGVVFMAHVLASDKFNQFNYSCLEKLIKAFKEGSSGVLDMPINTIAKEFTDENPSSFIYAAKNPVNNLEYDFTKQGSMEVICCLTGDLHNDNFSTFAGCSNITTTCSAGDRDGKGLEDTNEDAWDIVTIDRAAHRIYFTRFGVFKGSRNHEDRAFDYKDNRMLTIDENGNIVG